MNFPTNVKYTSEHEWIRFEGEEAFENNDAEIKTRKRLSFKVSSNILPILQIDVRGSDLLWVALLYKYRKLIKEILNLYYQ